MKELRWSTLCLLIVIVTAIACERKTAEQSVPVYFKALPIGWRVKESVGVPAKRTAEMARQLGVPIQNINNANLVANGRPLQINIFEVASPEDASTLHATILAQKKEPAFCIVKGAEVIEFVGDESMDADLATKAAFELGFHPKPTHVHYQVTAKLATVEEAEYMEVNKLFNLFLDKTNPTRDADINIAAQKMRFGKRLMVRAGPGYQFEPAPAKTTQSGCALIYEFENLPRDHDVPYVIMTADIETTADASSNSFGEIGAQYLSPTSFWPVDNPRIKSLADEITQGCGQPQEKVKALLEWLAPGKNIAFGGPVVGSRWGVEKVLDQKFGRCWDFSDCFVTLCRAAGIPARQVGGWVYGMEGHVWAEVFYEGAGWKQVDATGAGRLECGIYHIPYFVSDSGKMPIIYLDRPRVLILDNE